MFFLTSEEKLKWHLGGCRQNSFQKIEFPESLPFEKPILKFKNIRDSLKQGFVAYADFESVLLPSKNDDYI